MASCLLTDNEGLPAVHCCHSRHCNLTQKGSQRSSTACAGAVAEQAKKNVGSGLMRRPAKPRLTCLQIFFLNRLDVLPPILHDQAFSQASLCAQATTLCSQVFGKANPRSRAGHPRACDRDQYPNDPPGVFMVQLVKTAPRIIQKSTP